MNEQIKEHLEPPFPLEGVALEEWNRVASFLYEREPEYFQLDSHGLSMYCHTYAFLIEGRKLAERNVNFLDADGNLIPSANYLQSVKADLARQCEAFLLPCDRDGRMVIDGSIVRLNTWARNELGSVDEVLLWGDFTEEQQDEPACVEWHRVIPELYRLNLLKDGMTGLELFEIKTYCQCFEWFQNPQIDPCVPKGTQKKWRREKMKQICKQFGVAHDKHGVMVFSENVASLDGARKRKAELDQ